MSRAGQGVASRCSRSRGWRISVADLLIIVLSTMEMNLTGRDNVGSADRFCAKFLDPAEKHKSFKPVARDNRRRFADFPDPRELIPCYRELIPCRRKLIPCSVAQGIPLANLQTAEFADVFESNFTEGGRFREKFPVEFPVVREFFPCSCRIVDLTTASRRGAGLRERSMLEKHASGSRPRAETGRLALSRQTCRLGRFESLLRASYAET